MKQLFNVTIADIHAKKELIMKNEDHRKLIESIYNFQRLGIELEKPGHIHNEYEYVEINSIRDVSFRYGVDEYDNTTLMVRVVFEPKVGFSETVEFPYNVFLTTDEKQTRHERVLYSWNYYAGLVDNLMLKHSKIYKENRDVVQSKDYKDWCAKVDRYEGLYWLERKVRNGYT